MLENNVINKMISSSSTCYRNTDVTITFKMCSNNDNEIL
jgi:hypothetical protein